MYSATFLIAVHPSSVTSSISHRSTVTSTWREVRTRASRRPSSSSVNRPQATTYGRDSGLPILSMTAMTGESSHLEARLHSRTIWGAPPPKVYSPESLQNAGFCRRFPVRRGLAARRRDGLLGLAATAWLRGSVLTTPRCAASRSGVDRTAGADALAPTSTPGSIGVFRNSSLDVELEHGELQGVIVPPRGTVQHEEPASDALHGSTVPYTERRQIERPPRDDRLALPGDGIQHLAARDGVHLRSIPREAKAADAGQIGDLEGLAERVAGVIVGPQIRSHADVQTMIGGVPSGGCEIAGPSQRLPRVEPKHAATARQAEDRRSDRSPAAFPREDVQNIVCRVVRHALEVIGPVWSGRRTAAESVRGLECLFPDHPFESPGPRGDFEDRVR